MTEVRSGQKAAAWAVHAFTATGVVLAFVALLAVEQRDWAAAMAWLFAALVVDGVDGAMARAVKVKESLPRIDGAALDLVIDYLSYVFVPVLFLWRSDFLPPGWAFPLCAGILVSSLYIFARSDMKTDDGYFRGFPALWNLVAFYLFVTQPGAPVAGMIVALLIVMTFAPVHVVHPFRVRDYGRFLPVLSVIWGLATVALLLPLGAARPAILWASAAMALVLIALGLLRTMRGPRQAQ